TSQSSTRSTAPAAPTRRSSADGGGGEGAPPDAGPSAHAEPRDHPVLAVAGDRARERVTAGGELQRLRHALARRHQLERDRLRTLPIGLDHEVVVVHPEVDRLEDDGAVRDLEP